MTDNPTTEARSPRIESWLRSHGFFAWGTDAWIHEDDESLVMDTLSAIEAAIEAQAAALPAPEPLDHEHEVLGVMPQDYCAEGRALLVGRLTKPIEGAPLETHCLHVTTPLKGEVVFGITEWDLAFVAAMAEIVNDGPLNSRWVTNQARLFTRLRDEKEHPDD